MKFIEDLRVIILQFFKLRNTALNLKENCWSLKNQNKSYLKTVSRNLFRFFSLTRARDFRYVLLKKTA
jgi:hypothetical protein